MPQRVTNSQLLEDIRELATRLNRQPTSLDYKQYGKYAHTLPAARFGSWAAAINAAGLFYRYPRPEYSPSDAEVVDDVRRVAQELGKPPTAREYEERGKFRTAMVCRRAPEHRWPSALIYCLGISEDEASKVCARSGRRYRSNEERLAELRQLASQLGRTPPRIEAQKYGINTDALVARFGSWAGACKAAGLGKTKSLGKNAYNAIEDKYARTKGPSRVDAPYWCPACTSNLTPDDFYWSTAAGKRKRSSRCKECLRAPGSKAKRALLKQLIPNAPKQASIIELRRQSGLCVRCERKRELDDTTYCAVHRAEKRKLERESKARSRKNSRS